MGAEDELYPIGMISAVKMGFIPERVTVWR